jgi:CubicO group peptidase (beta-lactamase class C family)
VIPAAARPSTERPASAFVLRLAGLAIAALLAAGCSPGPEGTASGSPTGGTPAPSGAVAPNAYSACMRSNGVPTFPDPGPDGQIELRPDLGIDLGSDVFKAAERACEPLAPKQRQTPGPDGRAPTTSPDWSAFDDYLTGLAAAGQFSGAVLAVEGDDPVLERAYGQADREQGIPNSIATKFNIASLGKMFTAVAIAQLVEDGKLTFDDPVGEHLAGLPSDIAAITLAQLLTHTSGLADVALGRPTAGGQSASLDELLDRIASEPLRFEPGSRFAYSNDGFIVLGEIIEAVTGEAYPDYVRKMVFEPAGMSDTEIRSHTPADVPGMAHGYASGKGGAAMDISDVPHPGNPSGGAYSTVEDLHRFARALLDGRLLGPSMTEAVLAGKVKTDRPGAGDDDRYGYGFADQTMNGVRFVGHNGGTPGYEGQLDIYPDRDYVVVILTNMDGVLVPVIRRSEELLTT